MYFQNNFTSTPPSSAHFTLLRFNHFYELKCLLEVLHKYITKCIFHFSHSYVVNLSITKMKTSIRMSHLIRNSKGVHSPASEGFYWKLLNLHVIIKLPYTTPILQNICRKKCMLNYTSRVLSATSTLGNCKAVQSDIVATCLMWQFKLIKI